MLERICAIHDFNFGSTIPSLIVPVTDLFVEVLNNKVPALVIFAVTASLKVAVLVAAFTILVAVTAAAKEALLFKVNTSNEVAPTIPVIDADPDPSVKVKSRAVPSLSTVAPKVMLLSVVVNMTSLLNTTAPEYVEWMMWLHRHLDLMFQIRIMLIDQLQHHQGLRYQ